MTPQEYFDHFVERAKERYNIEVTYDMWLTIGNLIRRQDKSSTLIAHRRDGELWHIIKSPLVPASMFVVFDKDVPVTCLPSTAQLRRTVNVVQKKAKMGKPVPKRVVVGEDDMFFRHCYHSMLDYYGHTLTVEEWENWNQIIARKEILFLQSNDGVKSGRLVYGGRVLVIAYKNNKALDVRAPSRYWQDKARKVSLTQNNASAILARKIREHGVVF